MKQKYTSKNLEELDKVAKLFITDLKEFKKFAFYAPMGAGKTTFIKAILQNLDVEDTISSPTYAIVNEYLSVTFGKIYHFDFYRLEDEIEAYDIGADEILESGEYCFIEWPENIPNLIPENCVKIIINVSEDIRTIEVST